MTGGVVKRWTTKKKESAVVPQSGVTWSGVEIYTLNFISIFFFLWNCSRFYDRYPAGDGAKWILFYYSKKKNRTTCWISRRICRNRAIYERVLCTYGAVYGRIIINCQRSTKLMILEHCCSISLFLSKRTRLSCQWLPLDVGAFEGFEKKKKGKKSFQVLEQMYRCQRDMRRFGGFSI